jgi:hypothetical protein
MTENTTKATNHKPRVATLLLALLTLVASVGFISPPAQAATYNPQTRIVLDEIAAVEVGGVHEINGQIRAIANDGTDAGYVDYGTVSIYRQLAGEAGLTLLGTVNVGQTFSFSAPAVRNATYRLNYSGGTEVYMGDTFIWKPSTRDAIGPVARALRVNFPKKFKGKFKVKVTVAPGFAKRNVLVQKDGSCTDVWRGAGKMKTNKRGVAIKKFKIKRGQMCFRFVVPGDANYAQNWSAVRAYRS